MSSEGHEAFEHEILELHKEFRSLATEHINILLSKLESLGLEVEVAWRIAQHKTEIYVNHVAHRIEQNVSVVSIFDLEDVAQK